MTQHAAAAVVAAGSCAAAGAAPASRASAAAAPGARRQRRSIVIFGNIRRLQLQAAALPMKSSSLCGERFGRTTTKPWPIVQRTYCGLALLDLDAHRVPRPRRGHYIGSGSGRGPMDEILSGGRRFTTLSPLARSRSARPACRAGPSGGRRRPGPRRAAAAARRPAAIAAARAGRAGMSDDGCRPPARLQQDHR